MSPFDIVNDSERLGAQSATRVPADLAVVPTNKLRSRASSQTEAHRPGGQKDLRLRIAYRYKLSNIHHSSELGGKTHSFERADDETSPRSNTVDKGTTGNNSAAMRVSHPVGIVQWVGRSPSPVGSRTIPYTINRDGCSQAAEAEPEDVLRKTFSDFFFCALDEPPAGVT